MHGLILAILLSGTLAAPQAPASSTHQLAAIQLAGGKRYSTEDVTRLSGLTVGKPVAIADLGAAANRLASTGLFKSVQYRYVTAAGKVTVIFEFEEAEWTVPVTFDNFVWFTDEEVTAAVTRAVPTFDGTVPANEGVPELIAGALQSLLSLRGLPGTVGLTPQADLKKKTLRYLFAVANPAPAICAVGITGATPGPEAEVIASTAALAGTAYSRAYVTGMSQGTLLDLYHRRGHWRAAFGQPSVTVDTGGCAGVRVTLQVSEGLVYAWERAEWTGNSALAAADLDSLMGIEPGDVADGSRITAGLARIRKAYGRIGHVTASAGEPAPRLDDSTRRAIFPMAISEGPQFRMGTVQFLGLTEADAESLQKRWKLQSGAVYDQAYPDEFYAKEVSPRRPARGKAPVMQMEIDRAGSVVNVRYVFE